MLPTMRTTPLINPTLRFNSKPLLFSAGSDLTPTPEISSIGIDFSCKFPN